MGGKKKFTDIVSKIGNPAIATVHLQRLENLGLIERKLVKEERSFISYTLTGRGEKVASVCKEYHSNLIC
jgi:DNA-binding HxlR family transcriptional regulator